MPRKTSANLPPLHTSDDEGIGRRIARIRKSRGWTQQQLADKIGISRTLVTDYEIGRLHLNEDMITRFAITLEVSADLLLGLAQTTMFPDDPDRKIISRLKEIEQLPQRQKKSLLLTIDTYLKVHQAENQHERETL